MSTSVTPVVSVIFPTTGRATRALIEVQKILKTTQGHSVEVVLVVDGGDVVTKETFEYSRLATDNRVRRFWLGSPAHGSHYAWNYGASMARGEYLVLGQDDVDWGEGWLDAAMRAMGTLPEASGLVGFNDGNRGGTGFPTSWLVSRRFCVEYMGGALICPKYLHQYGDVEAWLVAQRAGRYAWAGDAHVRHFHPAFGGRAADATDAIRGRCADRDAATFRDRLARGFPVEWEPVIE